MIGRTSSIKWKHFIVASLSAILIALLEVIWTGREVLALPIPEALLGVLVISLLLLIASWPRVWWVPFLLVVEGVVHTAISRGLDHTYAMFVHHWLANVIGYNIYPWILLLTSAIVIEYILSTRRG